MTTLYATTSPGSSLWQDLFEMSLQAQRRDWGKRSGRGHRPDISLSTRLLIASMINTDREDREHGTVVRVARWLATTRQTLYDIGYRYGSEAEATARDSPDPSARPSAEERRRRISEAALNLLVVAKASLRGVEECLALLLGEGRRHGWISELVVEAGQQAGKVLAAAEWSGSGEMIAARDELYFSDMAWLLTVDARSHAIISGHVEDSADAETWGLSLAMDQIRTGHRIVGLSEDEASFYPSSIDIAQKHLDSPFRLPAQKDHWHILDRARQIAQDAQRVALGKLAKAEKIAPLVRPGFWEIPDMDSNWKPALEGSEEAILLADRIWIAVRLLTEVLELVDRRTGEVLDRETASWYLEQIIQHLRDTDSEQAQSLAKALERQAEELLTFHEWMAMDLAVWRKQAQEHFEDLDLSDLFERAVSRAWQLQRAVTNGACYLKRRAERAAARLSGLCQNDPQAEALADRLTGLLETTIRTSSAGENVNSILRAYVWGRRAFKNRRTAQCWLNLLVLYYNMHVFQRGKRKGHSPFELAGVVVHNPDGEPTDDWIDALGYAKAA